MGTEFKDVDVNMEDSGNSCGSSVVSDHTDFCYDGDGVQVSDLDEGDELQLQQVGFHVPYFTMEFFYCATFSS